ncbi:hypothetical protein UlMin_005202 [Ulmus minor]
MQTLTYFTLSFNKLTGSIPSSLSNLTNLGTIHLDRNRLSRSIPESFGHFRKVSRLYLSHNELSEKIPSSLGNMDFATIDLPRNKLFVDLSRNLLEFDILKVEFSKSLTWMDLNHNKIWGKLPVGLAAFEYFQVFNVSYNSLCRNIPVGAYLQKLDDKSFFIIVACVVLLLHPAKSSVCGRIRCFICVCSRTCMNNGFMGTSDPL